LVRVAASTAETDGGKLIDHGPKLRAGRRTVAFPKEVVPELRWHVERFAQDGDHGLVFIGPKGSRLRRSNFRKVWTKAAQGGPQAGQARGIGHATGTRTQRSALKII
jgi:hypothetical protein